MTLRLHPFTSQLLKWYEANGRDLPWRHTHDAYAIWLSEIILQQTRIAQGLPYWQRFMETYPSVDALASASEDEILRLWQGLGYYSRARHLHEAAKQIVECGHFPTTYEDIRKLSGIGPYTAAAIASLAFGEAKPAIDENAYRVLSRYFGITTPIDTTKGKAEFQELGHMLIPADKPGAYNQAVMDFGSLQCTPKNSLCSTCPLKMSCAAFAEGCVETLPKKSKRTAVKERRLTYIYIRYKEMTALHRRPGGDILQGLWEPFIVEGADFPKFKGRLQLLAKDVRHLLTHRILLADFFLLDATTRPHLPGDFIWINESQLDNYAKPQLFCRLLSILNNQPEAAP